MDPRTGPEALSAKREATVELCRQDDLEEGQARGFTVSGYDRKVILVRRNGGITAYRDACPHYSAGTPMAWKTDAYLNGAAPILSATPTARSSTSKPGNV